MKKIEPGMLCLLVPPSLDAGIVVTTIRKVDSSEKYKGMRFSRTDFPIWNIDTMVTCTIDDGIRLKKSESPYCYEHELMPIDPKDSEDEFEEEEDNPYLEPIIVR